MRDKECSIHRLVADVFLLAAGQVLLARYRDVKRYDGESGWFLPDDLVRHMEHPDAAAKRILDDQVHLVVPRLALDHIESFGNGRWHLVFHYRAELPKLPALEPSPDVLETAWFQLDRLPDAAAVAHGGWALEVIQEMTAGSER